MADKKAELKVDLRPTLFIGAGGTGMEVMMRIRRRILSAVWNRRNPTRVEAIGQFPVARFLHVDLDSGAIIDEGKSQRTDPWYELVKLSDEERLVESIDLQQYHESDDSLARFPLIESWMPLRPKKLRSLGIDPSKGAGQIRAVARLYLFDKYPKLRGRIKGALNFLSSNAGNERKENYQRLGLQVDTSKFRIVVIGSNAGGTGAGTVMDLGWIAKAIARQEVADSQVDLVMFMPSGYAKANKERTEANAYATLMELETAMRDMNAQVRWADPDSLTGRGAPFDDVYFVDTANLANKATQDVKDVYQMVADSLFEDFASADFANRKRSVAVNQQQHKLGPFNPRVPEQRFGDMRLSYSKVYSAFGQSVLDTQQSLREDIRAYELAALMVKAFFGLLGSDGAPARRAGDQERDTFMREQMALSERPFDEFPDFKKGTVDVTPFQEYALTDRLLMDKDERSLLERVESKVQLEIDRIMGDYELKQWREKVAELLPHLERDAIREAGATAETSEDRLKRHTAELLQRLKGRAREQLYALLDDRKQGGLEFVLSLLEQIKSRISQRDLAHMERNGKRYRDIRDALRTRQVEESLNNLSQAAAKLFGSDAQSREVMAHLKRDISDYLRFHMLSVAAAQSVELLRSMSSWLGDVQSVDEQGQPVYGGIAGELQEGRRCVEAMLGAVDQRIAQLRADAQHEHATYMKLASDTVPDAVKLTGDISVWSEEVLMEFGGSARLFPQLGDEKLRASLLLKLFRRAQTQLSREHLDEADVAPPDPLLERLMAMSPQERQHTFNEWIRSAMPWINARFSAEFTPNADQFKCFIGVGDANAWRKLEPEIKAAVPTGFFHGDLVSIVNNGISGKAVCYIELSGVPMTVLRGLPTWRTSYQIENPKIPTHLHFDSTRFRHPIAPSMDELNRLADDYEWFLQAIALGVIKRKADLSDREALFQPRGQYLFEVEQGSGEWLQIGNEFAIRSNGLPAYYREQVIASVQQRLARMGANQFLLLAALMRYYQHKVYQPKLEVDETGAELPSPSLPNITAKRLHDEWMRRAQALNAGLPGAPVERALETLGMWSEQVTGSANDAYNWEVQHAVDKRVLKPEILAGEAAAARVFADAAPGARDAYASSLAAAGVSAAAGSAAYAAAPAHAVFAATPSGAAPQTGLAAAGVPVLYKVFVNKTQQGPYALHELAQRIQAGEIDGSTKVWNMQWIPRVDQWKLASDMPDIAPLLGPAIPDPYDDIPDPE
ncbi:GYF domain-containing protein [Pseudoduganella sp. LjRoot289]|uniref:tubulin-like doman-containing protein n=1 Tax=Pseudoduganella sp. LjRoot289 TaxID=3342314 RepID=UPI003ECEDB3C